MWEFWRITKMAKTCLECLKKHLDVTEVGDVIVEKKDCDNCYGGKS